MGLALALVAMAMPLGHDEGAALAPPTTLAPSASSPSSAEDGPRTSDDSSNWLDALGPAAVLAAVVGAAAAYFLERRKSRLTDVAAARNLASALNGEVTAMQRIATARYLPNLRRAAERVRKGKTYVFAPAYSGNELFGVYRANAGHLGILPHPLPQAVADLYTEYLTIQEDLRTVIIPEWVTAIPRGQQVLFLNDLVDRLSALEVRSANVSAQLLAFASHTN